VLAALLLAGCGAKEQSNGERLDPAELDTLPSILASGRQLVDEVQKQSGPVFHRDAHAKAHGCLTATFAVRADLPEELRTAVFVPGKTYPAWIRFSNGNAALQPDNVKDARGMAIKLMGVPPPMLLTSPAEAQAGTQDFLMINHPVFFNRNAAEYESFIRYQSDDSKFGYFFQGLNPSHWRLRELLIGSRLLGRIANPLYAQYHSMTAYALGVDASSAVSPLPYRNAMKYSARSCTPPDHRSPDTRQDDYLRRGLAEHLAKSDACFEFLVQVQDPAKNMPIEDPRVEWRESDAPFQRVATVTIPAQVFDTPERDAFCENLAFTPWHGHIDHRPLGSLNRIRKAVYEGIAVYRHARNCAQFGQVPYGEPTDWSLDLPTTDCSSPIRPASSP
jgi:catalase